MNYDRGRQHNYYTGPGSSRPFVATASTMSNVSRGRPRGRFHDGGTPRLARMSTASFNAWFAGTRSPSLATFAEHLWFPVCVEDPFWHWWLCCGSCPATSHPEFAAGYSCGRPVVGSDLQWGWSRSRTHTTAPGLCTCCRFGASRPLQCLDFSNSLDGSTNIKIYVTGMSIDLQYFNF